MKSKHMMIFLVGIFLIGFPQVGLSADVELTSDGKVPGQPFQSLQDQIDNIQLTPGLH
ncbi:MAG: hypothetical protein JSV50_00255 [Desulfobacteraceae bacterium]|nr:MAG: hypothetical protein JSV50_00255 [Desulfobacteraceae bacterium]